VAVTVEETPQMVLDENYLIVEIGPDVEAGFGPLAGRPLWDAYPGSEALFQPYYEKARMSGEPVEFVQFYNGYLTRIRAVPKQARLQLFWKVLCRLDTLTLDGLAASLATAIAHVEESEALLGREQVRGLLTVVEGGRA
jgi:hypothetical protein